MWNWNCGQTRAQKQTRIVIPTAWSGQFGALADTICHGTLPWTILGEDEWLGDSYCCSWFRMGPNNLWMVDREELEVKWSQEIRDPIHDFVRMSPYERKIVDSRPYQRLRDISQLAMTYRVYPGATHKRFEHCLGVMELSERLFNTVTEPANLEYAKHLVEPLTDEGNREYWRKVVRIAALCHDLGHLPFSHAGEELLPEGEDHETVTLKLIESEIAEIIETFDFGMQVSHVKELAVKTPGLEPWKQVLAEIIQSNFFGVDRIDYLLRDSHHAGVAYGKFDHYRLLDTVRILPSPPGDESEGTESVPLLGVEGGGVSSAESLLLARHFMFSQVYFHPVRRIYDQHLADFLESYLPDGKFATDPESMMRNTDSRILVAIAEASDDPDKAGHDAARRLACREHFRLVYQPAREDYRTNLEAGKVVYEALIDQFEPDVVRWSEYPPKDGALDFPVLVRGELEAASSRLEVLTSLPPTRFDGVFVAPEKQEEATQWLKANKQRILEQDADGDDDE